MPEVTDPKLLEQLNAELPPAPGLVEGVGRAAGESALGIQPGSKDQAFQRDNPIASQGGGMLGRAADVVLPILGGRAAGGMLARSMKPMRNVDLAASQAEANAARQFGRIKNDRLRNANIDAAMIAAREAATKNNASATALKNRMTFGGGLVGGAAGGAGGAYLNNEDPGTGALYGGAVGLVPPVASAIPGGAAKWIAAPAVVGGAVGLETLGKHLPDPIGKVASHGALGLILNLLEGKKK